MEAFPETVISLLFYPVYFHVVMRTEPLEKQKNQKGSELVSEQKVRENLKQTTFLFCSEASGKQNLKPAAVA